MMKITIRDVAKAAGVSPASVSLVLNNKPSRISEKTKQRIFETAGELGYLTESMHTQNTARHSSNTIGVIVPGIRNIFSLGYLLGIEAYAELYGYRIVSCDLGYTTGKCLDYLSFLRESGASGVILMPPEDVSRHENGRLLEEAICSSDKPCILIGSPSEHNYTDFVTSDYKSGAYTATDHLIRNGHSRIAFLSSHPDLYSSRKKLEGYKEALLFYGIAAEDSLISIGAGTSESGYSAAGSFLQNGATAVLSVNDVMAFGMYRYASEHGLRIGEDLSVVCFNNSEYCEYLTPPLTSISEEYAAMGRKACERLIRRITNEDPDGPKSSYFVPKLIERQSVRNMQ